MNQKANASEINEIKQSGLKYLTDITSNDRIINHSKLSTKTIKRINRQIQTTKRKLNSRAHVEIHTFQQKQDNSNRIT